LIGGFSFYGWLLLNDEGSVERIVAAGTPLGIADYELRMKSEG